MTNHLLTPSCLPLPCSTSSASGCASSRRFCSFQRILQPARCPPCLHFSMLGRRFGCFEEPIFKSEPALFGAEEMHLLAKYHDAGWQDREPLSVLLAMFSPLHQAPAAAGRARSARCPSEEGKLLGAKSQLPKAKIAGAGRYSAANRCLRAWSKGCWRCHCHGW